MSILNSKTGQSYKQFEVGSFNTIGVDELEPFTIKFKNNTRDRIQVKLSVDGTDVLISKPASTSNKGDMFLVEPYESVNLKAWPEDTKGGAEFLFTPERDGVAINTHGNTSSKGIIAAAVFIEGKREKSIIEKIRDLRALTGLGLKDTKDLIEHTHGDESKAYDIFKEVKELVNTYAMTDLLRDFIGAKREKRSNTKLFFDDDRKGVTKSCDTSYGAKPDWMQWDMERAVDSDADKSVRMDFCGPAAGAAACDSLEEKTLGHINIGEQSRGLVGGNIRSKSLAVGAGDRVDQFIKRASSGLILPVLETIVQVKYMPWTDLRPRVRNENNHLSYAHPGFPGDAEQLCNIKNTPRYEERPYGVVRRVREEAVKKFEDISRFE